MKISFWLGILLVMFSCSNVTKKAAVKPSLRSILLEQLRNTHTNKDWYIPLNTAVEGLTAEQANWSDNTDNHSIGQLVSHLTFWNERSLIAFHGNTLPDFSDNNEETFAAFNKDNWQQMMSKSDSIQTAWEKAVEQAGHDQLNKWSSSIANMCSHNAYHTGQIVYIRKKNGWWNKANGVK